jgi:hypothetical protein
MKTSKNPKVLNYIIRNVLDPIFSRLEKLKEKEKEERDFLNISEKKANDNIKAIYEGIGKYTKNDETTRHMIEGNNEILSSLIRSKLYNPNLMDDEGSGGAIVPDTPLITDKSLNCLSYGYIKDGVGILLGGIINKGLAVGPEENTQGNYEFYNPLNNKFPSFSPNSILKTTQSTALVATNNGLIDIDLALNTYIARTTSYGLNTNLVTRIVSVANTNAEKIGYVAGTSKGISFSPTGIRWLNIDKKFTRNVICFHRTQKINESLKEVFIGTTRGIYYFNINEYVSKPEDYKIAYMSGIAEILPSYYINSLAYDTVYDKFYIATDSGILLIYNFSSYIQAGDFSLIPPTFEIFDALHGLSSTMCFDVVVMPNHKVFIATANGLTITSDFKAFSYITKKASSSDIVGLNSYMCSKLERKNNNALTVIHPVGFTEGIYT